MKKKIVHGSTFSGIGAPEIAAEMLGWENAFHCEINPFGRHVLDYYFPNAESYEDITKTDFSKWRDKITVLTGGFPCQPFSYAGKRKGSEDNRYLWPYMLKCIQEVRPTWFIGENVSGITTMVLPCKDAKVGEGGTLFDKTDYMARNEKFVIEEICQQLESAGYSVQPMLIPACAVGAPHRRDRVFFIAHRDDAQDSLYGGQLVREHDEQGSERNIRNTGTRSAERICGEERIVLWTDSDTDSVRGQKDTEWGSNETRQDGCDAMHEYNQQSRTVTSRSGNTIPSKGAEISGQSSSDTDSTRQSPSECESRRERQTMDRECERRSNNSNQCDQRTERQSTTNTFKGNLGDRERYGYLQPENRWRTFPTVSPVYRGNDGLPFDVDSLTIPFSRWKKESIKAYGNAIVVQVMYRIFEAIDKIENEYEQDNNQ